MEKTTTNLQPFTEQEIFEKLKEILHEVAPIKVVREITPEISLVDDFAFDSIDIMTMMLKIQQAFVKDYSTFDIDRFIEEAYQEEQGKVVTAKIICELIQIFLKEVAENGKN